MIAMPDDNDLTPAEEAALALRERRYNNLEKRRRLKWLKEQLREA